MNKSDYWFGIAVYTYVQLGMGIMGAIAFSVARATQYVLPGPVYIVFVFACASLWGLFHVAVIGVFLND